MIFVFSPLEIDFLGSSESKTTYWHITTCVFGLIYLQTSNISRTLVGAIKYRREPSAGLDQEASQSVYQ